MSKKFIISQKEKEKHIHYFQDYLALTVRNKLFVAFNVTDNASDHIIRTYWVAVWPGTANANILSNAASSDVWTLFCILHCLDSYLWNHLLIACL